MKRKRVACEDESAYIRWVKVNNHEVVMDEDGKWVTRNVKGKLVYLNK